MRFKLHLVTNISYKLAKYFYSEDHMHYWEQLLI